MMGLGLAGLAAAAAAAGKRGASCARRQAAPGGCRLFCV
ncbi:MAG: hypothetical protein QM777_24860 [Pseudorhodoferax sp.]